MQIVDFPAILTKKALFDYVRFAFLYTKPFSEKGTSLEEKNLLPGIKLFHFFSQRISLLAMVAEAFMSCIPKN